MKLCELDATFVRHTGGHDFAEVATLAEADGVLFDCAKCQRHSVLAWGRSIPQDVERGPGRWIFSGTGLGDLTLSPSINLERGDGLGCGWHGWVKDGDAT